MASRDVPVRVRIGAVDRLSQTIDKVKAKFPELARAARRSGLAFEIANKQLEKFKKTSEKIGNGIKKAGQIMTVGITLPAIAAGGYSLKAFMDYQTALTGVGKTTNLSGQELLDFGEKFRELSKTIPISVEELLQLGQTAAQLGVKGGPNILKFSETLGKLARATNIQGEEGASNLARLLTITKVDMGNVDRMGSALVALGNSSAATESEILGFATRLGGATALFGFSGTQVLGYATAMKSVGIEAEAGSSAVQRALGQMNKSISTGGQKLSVLSKITGIATGDLKKRFKEDAAGVLRDFVGGLSKLEQKGGDVTQALGYFGLAGVRDIAVLGALTKNTDLLNEKMNTAKTAFDANTALNNEFASATSTLASKLQLTKNKLNDLAITVGSTLAPAFSLFLDIVSGIATFLTAHPFFTILVGGAFATLAVLGPLLIVFGTFIAMWPSLVAGWAAFGVSIASVGGIAGLTTTALTALGTVAGVLLSPFVLIGAAIVAAVAIIWIYRDAIKQGIIDTWNWVIKVLGAAIDKIGLATSAMKRFFGFSGGNVNINSAATPQGASPLRLVPQGANVGGAASNPATVNSEFNTQTNNARVDVFVRAPESTKIRSESQNGVLNVSRGAMGTW